MLILTIARFSFYSSLIIIIPISTTVIRKPSQQQQRQRIRIKTTRRSTCIGNGKVGILLQFGFKFILIDRQLALTLFIRC